MTEVIAAQEHTEWCAALCDEDLQFLRAELGQQVTVRQEVREGKQVVVLNPNQYVGLIFLPSGLRLEIRPKVPIANLFYMLSLSFRMAWPFREEWAQLQSFEDILSVIAESFAELVERRLTEGLYRAYLEQEDNVAFIRGRIRFTEDLRRNCLTRQRVYCQFAEFTWDIPENQIIRQVAHLLSGWGFQPKLRVKLSQLDSALGEITPTAMPGTVIAGFRYNRFNDDYRQIHQLCRLFLEGSSLSEQLGVWDSRAFLLDMNQLFEQFITELLVSEAQGRTSVDPQVAVLLGEDGKISMRPDLLIRRDGLAVLAADCKYKRTESEAYKNHDYYQILSYCIATGVKHGMLIYPLDVVATDDTVRVRNTCISIEQKTINLGLPFKQFQQECGHFAGEVLSLATLSALEMSA